MMKDMEALFKEALHDNSIDKMMQVPKSDLHNHAGRGGNMRYLAELKGCSIIPSQEPFDSLGDMQHWFENNIKVLFPGMEGNLKRVEASFVQAAEDNIKVLSLSYGIDEIEMHGGMEQFIGIMNGFHRKHAPETEFYPELVLSEVKDIEKELYKLEAIFSYHWFKSVDWQGNETRRNINSLIPQFRKAKQNGLKLRAHSGEFGNADDIKRCVEELELDEVHHGISAANSDYVMRFLADNKVQLNVCPTSNVMLKRVNSYGDHPIRLLYDHGIQLSINTDDLLIFNATASQEYLNLYHSGRMSEDELNNIRITGLNTYHSILP